MKITVIINIVLCILYLPALQRCGGGDREPEAAVLYDHGRDLALSGRKMEALSVYSRALAGSPDRKDPHCWSRLYYNRAQLLEELGMYADAATDYRESMAWFDKYCFYPEGVLGSDQYLAWLGEARCAAGIGDRRTATAIIDSCSRSVALSLEAGIDVRQDVHDELARAANIIDGMAEDGPGMAEDGSGMDLRVQEAVAGEFRNVLSKSDSAEVESMNSRMLLVMIGMLFVLAMLLIVSYEVHGFRISRRDGMINDLQAECDALKQACAMEDRISDEIVQLMNDRVRVINDLLSGKVRQGKEFDTALERLSGNRTEILESIGILYAVKRPSFVSFLMQKGLTAAEIGFCYLLLSGLSAKQAGAFICHSDYYSISSKIRSKLGIEPNSSTLAKWLKQYEESYID